MHILTHKRIKKYLFITLGTNLKISTVDCFHIYYFNDTFVAKTRLGSNDHYNGSIIRTLSSMFSITEEESESILKDYIFTHMNKVEFV